MPAAQCPPAVSDPAAATVTIFVRNTSVLEAVELSNLDSTGSSIDCDRLNGALKDAYVWLQSEKLILPLLCQQLVDANISRWMVVAARYYLDNIRRRPDVTADYEALLKSIERLSNVSAELASGSGLPTDKYSSISVHTGKSPVWTEKSLAKFRAQQ